MGVKRFLCDYRVRKDSKQGVRKAFESLTNVHECQDLHRVRAINPNDGDVDDSDGGSQPFDNSEEALDNAPRD